MHYQPHYRTAFVIPPLIAKEEHQDRFDFAFSSILEYSEDMRRTFPLLGIRHVSAFDQGRNTVRKGGI